MEPNYSWIYLVIFLAIPLARILPRVIQKARGKEMPQPKRIQDNPFRPSYTSPQTQTQPPKTEPKKPQSKDMLVLGELNRGAHSFDKIQKNTGFTNQELEGILEKLEKDGFLKVVSKQGLFGPKVELFPTDKGFKEYYT
ncbi:MAG: hypothetical protein HKM23_08170 [Nitrosopumilus sp.]|nr:hypothetical protein [Nitrosopumilus sp.]NNL58465.1 hypothetical protein [Nitrosopumilus sp.]